MVETPRPEPSPSHGSARVRVAASPEAAFALLTDLELLAQLSPENQRCELLGDDTAVYVGARFRGDNKAGDYEWHADCVVTKLEAGRHFADEAPPDFEHATTWSYTIEADADGCVMTEAFHAPFLEHPELYPGRIEGRRDNLERACEMTMANLKAELEG